MLSARTGRGQHGTHRKYGGLRQPARATPTFYRSPQLGVLSTAKLMAENPLEQWLELVPKPWTLKADQRWHIYLMFRSPQRIWAVQLYDILKSLGYDVFMAEYAFSPEEVRESD